MTWTVTEIGETSHRIEAAGPNFVNGGWPHHGIAALTHSIPKIAGVMILTTPGHIICKSVTFPELETVG